MLKVDSDRLERSKDVVVSNGVFGGWTCSSGSGKEWKVSYADNKYVCTCPDFKKGNTCKHIIAVLKLNKEEFEVMEKESSSRDYSKYQRLGYDRYEVVSAFHKELRREDFKAASYWLQVIMECEPNAAFYVNNYFSGIIGEELCTCDPQVVVNIKSFLNYKVVDDYMLYAVTEHFCKAKKWWQCKTCADRRRVWFNNKVALKNSGKKFRLEIPGYALDPHTRRGKQLHKEGKADMRWSGRAEGMFWRRACVEQGKDLLTTKWEEVDYKELSKMEWLEDIWYKD